MWVVRKIFVVPKKILLTLISIYQSVLSPDHSFWSKWVYPCGYCKFHPTCSEYVYRAVKKKGVIKGVVLGGWRILRCNPWSKGGVDKV